MRAGPRLGFGVAAEGLAARSHCRTGAADRVGAVIVRYWIDEGNLVQFAALAEHTPFGRDDLVDARQMRMGGAHPLAQRVKRIERQRPPERARQSANDGPVL